MEHMNFTLPELETIAKLQTMTAYHILVVNKVLVTQEMFKELYEASLQDLINGGVERQVKHFDKSIQ